MEIIPELYESSVAVLDHFRRNILCVNDDNGADDEDNDTIFSAHRSCEMQVALVISPYVILCLNFSHPLGSNLLWQCREIYWLKRSLLSGHLLVSYFLDFFHLTVYFLSCFNNSRHN